ncbi:hypothetical protein OQA88_12481 [Cercophora sp. LCS_1]
MDAVCSALASAILADDTNLCRALLDAHPDALHAQLSLPEGMMPSHDATWGPTLDYERVYKTLSPLLLAVLAPLFREKNAGLRALSPSGISIVKLLAERGAKIWASEGHVATMWREQILLEVCRDYDEPEVVAILVATGANVFTSNTTPQGYGLVHVAARRGAVRSLEFLFARGLATSSDRNAACSPLHLAAEKALSEVVELLLRHGATAHLHVDDIRGRTPLLCAVGMGFTVSHHDTEHQQTREKTIRHLIEADAQVTVALSPGGDKHSNTSILGYVSRWGSPDIVHYLVSKGANVNEQFSFCAQGAFPFQDASPHYGIGGKGVTPLHMAALGWNHTTVDALLALGANPAALDSHDRSPMHWATIANRLSGHFWFLQDYGIWHHEITNEWANMTPEQRASRTTSLDATLVSLLQQPASQPNWRDSFQRTALHYAAHMKFVSAIKLLVAHGAALDAVDETGANVLHELVHPLFFPRQKKLFEEGLVDEDSTLVKALRASPSRSLAINEFNNSGDAPLHVAAREASYFAAQLMVALSADVEQKNADDVTPLDFATAIAHWVHPHTYSDEELGNWADASESLKVLFWCEGVLPDDEHEQDVLEEIKEGRANYLANYPA